MSGSSDDGIELTVEGAHKRDAGRGIARLPESARSQLGVLSGDPVIVEGDRMTVVKVWPADEQGEFVRIDADTRANAGVNIGETVTVSQGSVVAATDIAVQPVDPIPGTDEYEYTVRDRLVDRMVQADERVHVDVTGPAGDALVRDPLTSTVPALVAWETLGVLVYIAARDYREERGVELEPLTRF